MTPKPPPRRILLLDIDGCLNGHEKHPDSPYTMIRPDCVQRLNAVLRATGCQLVISSAWRYMLLKTSARQPPAMSLTGFRYLLHTHGLVFHAHGSSVIGHTCADAEEPEREDQIRRWVREHLSRRDRWAVVDDLPLRFGRQAWRFVQTDGSKGLQDGDVGRLVTILGAREDSE